MDINALLERPSTASSPGNASTSSRKSSSTSSTRGRRVSGSAHMSTVTTATTPVPLPGPPLEPQHPHHYQYTMQPSPYPPYHYAAAPVPSPYHMSPYPGYPPTSMPMSGHLPPLPMHVSIQGPSNKRLAPPNPLPGESPAKKKQSKWTADEDASIIELRGNGMKWEDISKHLPGRSAISCRLRFQNYLERRSEWDEEKKNKLARLYERFKKDMWEKISKEMALPWRAAEAMHWQIGEAEMAQRANVPVFHLAGQQSGSSNNTSSTANTTPGAEGRAGTTSPASARGATSYSHTHSHGLPQQIPLAHAQPTSHPASPVMARGHGRRSSSVSPNGTALPSLSRCRADSARSVPVAGGSRAVLPSLSELSAGPGGHPVRYTMSPPVSR